MSKLVEQKLPKDFFCVLSKPPQSSLKNNNLKSLCPRVHLNKYFISPISRRANCNSATHLTICSPKVLTNPAYESKEKQSEEFNSTEDSLLGLSEFIPIANSQKAFHTSPDVNKLPLTPLITNKVSLPISNKKGRLILLKQALCMKNIEKINCKEVHTERTRNESMLTLRKRNTRKVIRLMQNDKDVTFGFKDTNI